MENIYIFSLLAAAVSNSILIFILSNREDRSAIIIFFIFLLGLINAWGIPQLLINFFDFQGDLFISLDKISALGYIFIPITFFLFALSFTNRLEILRNYLLSLFLLILPGITFIYFAWNTNLIESRDPLQITKTSYGYMVPTGELFPIVLIWFESLIIAAMYFIFNEYRTSLDKSRKEKSLWILIATSIPFIFGTVTNGILPLIGLHVFPLAIPLTGIMVLIIAYAIFRYELFEVSSTTILSGIGSGVITINNIGEIIQINSTAIELLGFGRKKVIKKTFSKLISLREERNHGFAQKNQVLKRVLEKGEKIVSNELFISSEKKKKFPVNLKLTPIKNGKEIVGAIFIFDDISKEKELEKSKNEFISIASHELRTPITTIKGFSQILEKRLEIKGDEKNKFMINNINLQLDKIVSLINDLLNVSRLEEGRFPLYKKKFDIDLLVENIATEFNYTITSHQIIKKGKVSTYVFADEDRIRQVLINLITNAIKYSPKSEKVVVEISKSKEQITISVQDFGVGIPKGDQTKVFNRYYRSGERKVNISGFGLGLYISSEIIKRHNGRIWVESKLKKGSKFKFTFPIDHL